MANSNQADVNGNGIGDVCEPELELKLDFGQDNQDVADGYQEFSDEKEVDTPTTKTFDGIDVTIAIAGGATAGYRNYQDSCSGGGDLGGDYVYPDDPGTNGPGVGTVILTLGNLSAGDYTLVSYHNDNKINCDQPHDPQAPIDVIVSGEVSASADDLGVAQTQNNSDDDNLGQSTVTFSATGAGNVVITYDPTAPAGSGNDGRAILNGIELTAAAPVPSCACLGDMNNDGWISPADVSAVVTQLLPYQSNAYWRIATSGHCGEMNGDGWLSPSDVSAIVTRLLPKRTNAYWMLCE